MAVELPSSEVEVQALLKSAVLSRASHIRCESQTITMANVRRLLESDLGLQNSALDTHKAFIRQLVDEVLLSSDNVEAQEEGEEQKAVSEEVPKKTSGSKQVKKSTGKKAREENGSVEDFEDLQEEDVHGGAPKKKKQKEKKRRGSSKEEDENGGGSNAEKKRRASSKEEDENGGGSNAEKKRSSKEEGENGGGSNADMSEEEVHAEAPKKKQQQERKEKEISDIKEEDENGGGSNAEMSEEEVHVEAPKKQQRKERKEKETSDSKEVDEDGSGSHVVMSEEDSDVSEAKKAKKVSPKIASVKPMQNKKIEHLKKIIKACGLTIPPQIYKRAKQQPDDKHDKFLIKELEDYLSRRGLSSNPSDKEIKAAKQKIAREKDLEGIDTTNIILEPRGRRATSQLFAPVYNPPPVEYDSEGDDEEESEDGAEEESEDGAEGSEDEGKDFAAAEDPEDSD